MTSLTLHLALSLFLSLASLRGVGEPYLASVDKQGNTNTQIRMLARTAAERSSNTDSRATLAWAGRKTYVTRWPWWEVLKPTRRATLSHGEKHERSSLLFKMKPLFCCGRWTSLSAHLYTSNNSFGPLCICDLLHRLNAALIRWSNENPRCLNPLTWSRLPALTWSFQGPEVQFLLINCSRHQGESSHCRVGGSKVGLSVLTSVGSCSSCVRTWPFRFLLKPSELSATPTSQISIWTLLSSCLWT